MAEPTRELALLLKSPNSLSYSQSSLEHYLIESRPLHLALVLTRIPVFQSPLLELNKAAASPANTGEHGPPWPQPTPA